jgi:hypothetical protein
LLIHEFYFGIYSLCRAKPELMHLEHCSTLSLVESSAGRFSGMTPTEMRLKASGIDLEVVPAVGSAHLGLERAELSGSSRRRQISLRRVL